MSQEKVRTNGTTGETPWDAVVTGYYPPPPSFPSPVLGMADVLLTIAGAKMRHRGWQVIRGTDGRIEACAPRVKSEGRMNWRPLLSLPPDINDAINEAVLSTATAHLSVVREASLEAELEELAA